MASQSLDCKPGASSCKTYSMSPVHHTTNSLIVTLPPARASLSMGSVRSALVPLFCYEGATSLKLDQKSLSQELDSQDPMHKEFWDALMVIAEVELQEAVKQDELDWARLRGEAIPAKYSVKEAGLHEAVDSDVQMMLAGE